MYYGGFDTLPDSRASNLGGFLSFSFGHYWQSGLTLNLDGMGGYGASGIVDSATMYKRTHFIVLVNPSIGYNISSDLNNPLVISLNIPMDVYNMARITPQAFVNPMYFLGVSVFNRKMINQNLGIEYSLGYGFNILKRYMGASFDESFTFSGGNRFEASLGVILRRDIEPPYINRAKKADFYARIKGIYYNMNAFHATYTNADIIYPKANNFMLLFEVGMSMDWLYY
ncbi:hypothetical protein CQA53_08725 [Helicobacter didelphidarum]|uniref:Outer membrane beta-barrel protein n=2 Tax=Helicobacter didelphidarum TaxID=2040648 RepID=A0A3D8IDF8_9HELI|nr:hypothetical protein CQA53_08725 [Helicobacter didelphidarum]